MTNSTDVATRLRRGVPYPPEPGAHPNLSVADDMMAEAADLIEKLIAALEPFAKAGGYLPFTHGPDNEPIDDDEAVYISCCGFSLGDVVAADLTRARTALQEVQK